MQQIIEQVIRTARQQINQANQALNAVQKAVATGDLSHLQQIAQQLQTQQTGYGQQLPLWGQGQQTPWGMPGQGGGRRRRGRGRNRQQNFGGFSPGFGVGQQYGQQYNQPPLVGYVDPLTQAQMTANIVANMLRQQVPQQQTNTNMS